MEYSKLRLNEELIDPNFSGYKLSLDPLATYRLSLETDVDVKLMESNDMYSHQHVKAFGIHNHLFVDPWNMDTVWFIDQKWHVMKITMATETSISGPVSLFQIPDASNRQLIPNRLNVTLHFTSRNWCVISDGTGRLYLLKTGDRSQDEPWKEGYSGQPLGDGKHFAVLHSIQHSEDKMCHLDVLCLHVDETAESATKPSFVTRLEWITFSSDNETSFVLSRTRTLESPDVPLYAILHPRGSSLIAACSKPVEFVHDSLQPVVRTIDKKDESEEVSPSYTWMQSDEEVTVFFKLSPEIQKANVSYQLQTKRLDLKVEGCEKPLLTGDLYEGVKVDESTWLINDEHILELHLSKAELQRDWSCVVIGDELGQFLLDAEQLATINERLAPFTADVQNPDLSGPKKGFNMQQLEECDAFPDDTVAIWCLDGETHNIIQTVDISSHQWLFCGVSSAPERLPCICLRHDVDGVMWQPEPTESGHLTWHHVNTFNAFGYVQASKQERKFTVQSPSSSFVAIADCVRHVFIYRQPAAIISPLRNRKTGETVAAVAKQQLISLESVDPILGIQANDRRLFILSGKTVHAVRVNDD